MIEYRYPSELIRKLVRVKSRKTNEVPHELHHVFVMMIVYPRKVAEYNNCFEK